MPLALTEAAATPESFGSEYQPSRKHHHPNPWAELPGGGSPQPLGSEQVEFEKVGKKRNISTVFCLVDSLIQIAIDSAKQVFMGTVRPVRRKKGV